MAKWIKVEHNKRDGSPILSTYINLDMTTTIEYNHPDDHFLLSLTDSEDKIVIQPDQTQAYRTIQAYLNVIDEQMTQFQENLDPNIVRGI
jgi:hypothetical protein